MNDLLTQAIEPSILAEESNFKLIPLYNASLLLRDFIVETKHKLFETSIAQFLGLDEMVLQESAITCVFNGRWIHGRCNCIKFITYEQMMELLANTSNPRADKFKPLLSQAILTQVLPLFNSISHDEPKRVIDLNLSTANQPLTMSSQEIAYLVESRHDSVKRTIERLAEKGVIQLPPMVEREYINGLSKKQKVRCYMIGKRDSYVVVAQLSPEFTARLVDRWQELEEGLQSGKNNIQLVVPQSLPEALRLAATLAEEKETLQHERDEAIKTKTEIGSKREASAMGRVGALAKKVKELEAKISLAKPNYQYATVLAIQSRLKTMKVSGLKLTYYCNAMGLVMKDVPDDRFGAVHSYPAEAWRDVYQIDINTILNREV